MIEWKPPARWLTLAALAILPGGLSAQVKPAARFELPPAAWSVMGFDFTQDPAEEMDEEGRMTTSGFFLGIIGMLGGATIGSGVGNARCGRRCVGRYGAAGAATIGALVVPIGVHVAADQPKNLPQALGLSALAGAALWGAFNAFPGKPVALAPFVAAPLQVWLSMKMETRD